MYLLSNSDIIIGRQSSTNKSAGRYEHETAVYAQIHTFNGPIWILNIRCGLQSDQSDNKATKYS